MSPDSRGTLLRAEIESLLSATNRASVAAATLEVIVGETVAIASVHLAWRPRRRLSRNGQRFTSLARRSSLS